MRNVEANEASSFSPDLRRCGRTSMLVAATLKYGAQSVPVRIRNMSKQGALIEGVSLPTVGTPVTLVRASLVAEGTVAWVQAGRCGLFLSESIDALHWMSRTPPQHQAAVDTLMMQAREQIAHAPTPRMAAEPPRSFEQATSLPQQELALLIARLDKLGDALSADEVILIRHAESLQIIDEVQQRLDALSRRLA